MAGHGAGQDGAGRGGVIRGALPRTHQLSAAQCSSAIMRAVSIDVLPTASGHLLTQFWASVSRSGSVGCSWAPARVLSAEGGGVAGLGETNTGSQ